MMTSLCVFTSQWGARGRHLRMYHSELGAPTATTATGLMLYSNQGLVQPNSQPSTVVVAQDNLGQLRQVSLFYFYYILSCSCFLLCGYCLASCVCGETVWTAFVATEWAHPLPSVPRALAAHLSFPVLTYFGCHGAVGGRRALLPMPAENSLNCFYIRCGHAWQRLSGHLRLRCPAPRTGIPRTPDRLKCAVLCPKKS